MKNRITLLAFVSICMSCVSRHIPLSEIHISSLTNRKQTPGETLCLFSPYTGGVQVRPFARDFFLLTDSNGVCKIDNQLNWYWVAYFSTNSMECGYSLITKPVFPIRLDTDRTITSSDVDFLESSLNAFPTLPPNVNQFTNQLIQTFYMKQKFNMKQF